MCLWFYHIILPTLPHIRMISWAEEREEWKGMREEEEKEEKKTFYLSQESKIIQAQKSQIVG